MLAHVEPAARAWGWRDTQTDRDVELSHSHLDVFGAIPWEVGSYQRWW